MHAQFALLGQHARDVVLLAHRRAARDQHSIYCGCVTGSRPEEVESALDLERKHLGHRLDCGVCLVC